MEAVKRSRGRPRGDGDEVLYLRVSREEFDQVAAAAMLWRCSQNEAARRLIRGALGLATADADHIAELRAMLSRLLAATG